MTMLRSSTLDSRTDHAKDNRRSGLSRVSSFRGWMGTSTKKVNQKVDDKKEVDDDASVASTSTFASETSSQNSIANNSSHSRTSSLSAFHLVETPVFGIIAYLEEHGVPAHITNELQEMESQFKFTALLKKAEHCVERLVRRNSVASDLDEVLVLFVQAWTALRDYAQDRYSQIDMACSYKHNQYWEQVIAFQPKSEWEQDWLRQRQIAAHDAEAEGAIRDQLAQAMRFKIDCQKGLILTQEFTRYIKRIQRSLQQ